MTRLGRWVAPSLIAFFFLSTIPAWAQNEAAADTAQAAAGDASADAGSGGGDAALVAQGESLFKANCTQCHALDEQVVGPALRGAVDRWPSEAEMISFIRYPQRTIESGQPHAVELYQKYKQYMPNHDFLTEAQVGSIVAYIKNPPASAAPAAGTAGVDGDGAVAAASDSGVGGPIVTILLGGLIFVLVLVLIVLALMLSLLTKFLRKQEGLTEEDREFLEEKTDWGAIVRSTPFKAGVAFVALILLTKVAFDAVYSIGIQQHYAPTQPIAFSHKLHVGMYEINCAYCHTGVYKAKSANIPSPNICMNCHNQIKTESPEIKKIWNAVNTGTPIEWVRVHNLPDLAYFNHSQHTTVGGIECQTCHGQIQEMEVVEQHSSLTMGWCINCHRETVVKAEGNAYYDKLLQVHNAETGNAPMHVVDIGGLECSKCHY
ncbi:Cytochrome c, mono-and diheme variants [Catalinimonas alkaloidigena]|uniref:Cytochrome c, mono-and diheme variants n=1 Tax=Catalinimonas alkaloidigena TaxID=1075417 RepID=A0A1G9BH31_9BACT|nr:cytochrome c3 family protein [Catalinimonas alkaloidigena]SDK38826.1 Cytochrome c, mono-and diheme variants [Catalinimonas alkaloidigena]